MAQHSEQDLRYAAEFRAEIHKEALAVVRRTRPDISEVVDRHPAEDYLQEHWDYPGKWYTIVSIPAGFGSRKALFAPVNADEWLNYRKAFLRPPHGNVYTDDDFERVNAALFPGGADALEAYRWTTDWSDYFDEGHEWWGALCLTVYDKTLDRFVVILASASD